jgi:DNA-binding PadR family transcriptional regulator
MEGKRMTNEDEREPRDLLPLQPADFQVLLLLAEGPLHPYGLSKAVEAKAELGVELGIGSLYRMLNRMKSAGLIDEADGEETSHGPAARRRVFRLTGFGRRVARAEARRLEAVVEAARARDFLPQGRGG